ncbi:MAG: hypothetical protein E3K37_12450 [Candidatus Kuenenia sp.]|nr:hypothetical protein [Candidatus Kuenenia hertensis]
MRPLRYWLLSGAAGVSLLMLYLSFFIHTGYAIDNTPLWQGIDFDFNQPGARSRGIGGAFVGSADDATAAVANPAGLAQLPGVQFTVEGRTTTYNSEDVSWGGNTEGKINNEDITDLSFFAASFPVPIGKDSSLVGAVFFNKIANSDISINLPAFKFDPNEKVTPGITITEDFDFFDYTAGNELEIDEYGFSAGMSFWDEKIMVGAGLSILRLDLSSEFSGSASKSTGFGFGEDIPPESISAHGNSLDVAYRFGLLFHPCEKLSIGGNISIMPQLEYETSYNISVFDHTTFDVSDFDYTDQTQNLNIPDSYSIGATYRIRSDWYFFVEAKYIEYGDLMDGFRAPWGAVFDIGAYNQPGRYDIDDIWEYHLGTEYVYFMGETPIAFRLGTYFEPAHSLEFNAPPEEDVFNPEGAKMMEDLLDGGEDAWHFTFGLGTVIQNKYQIDFAADITDDQDKNTFILSGVYAF